MSWAEENGLCDWDFQDLAEQEEADWIRKWSSGWHEMASGKKIRISSMEDSHLANTIAYFKKAEIDTSILEREVARRENLIDKNFKL